MKEFAQKGYKNTSTDDIVSAAAISKGALFHYFKSKKYLFIYLYNYALDILKNDILLKFDSNEKDFFERRRQAMLLKIVLLKKHPEMYDFLTSAYLEESIEVRSELELRNKELIEYSKVLLNEGIDSSKFKEGIDVNKVIDIMTWTIDGYANKVMERVKNYSLYEQNYDEISKEMDTYLELLKKSFYK